MYGVLERNHTFLNFESRVRSVLGIQAVGLGHVFGYPSSAMSAQVSPQRCTDRPATTGPQVKGQD